MRSLIHRQYFFRQIYIIELLDFDFCASCGTSPLFFVMLLQNSAKNTQFTALPASRD
jgi:hypothetical protein